MVDFVSSPQLPNFFILFFLHSGSEGTIPHAIHLQFFFEHEFFLNPKG